MTALRSPTQPKRDITMNRGTTPSWTGTAIMAKTNTSSGVRPRKLSLAKENPASVENSTVEADTMTATSTLLTTEVKKLMSEPNTRMRLAHRLPCGMSDGFGLRAMLEASDEASRTA